MTDRSLYRQLADTPTESLESQWRLLDADQITDLSFCTGTSSELKDNWLVWLRSRCLGSGSTIPGRSIYPIGNSDVEFIAGIFDKGAWQGLGGEAAGGSDGQLWKVDALDKTVKGQIPG